MIGSERGKYIERDLKNGGDMQKTAKRKSSSKRKTHKKKYSLEEKVEELGNVVANLLNSHNHNAVVINTIKEILIKKGVIDPDKDLPKATSGGMASDLKH